MRPWAGEREGAEVTDDWKKEGRILALIVGVFLACFYLPVGAARFDNAVMESLHLEIGRASCRERV